MDSVVLAACVVGMLEARTGQSMISCADLTDAGVSVKFRCEERLTPTATAIHAVALVRVRPERR